MNDEVLVPTIILDDDLEYIVLDNFSYQNNNYMILTLENDPLNIIVSKVIDNIVNKLSNITELNEVLNVFFKRHPELEKSLS